MAFPLFSPTPGQPVVGISYGSDIFRLTCCEAFGLGVARWSVLRRLFGRQGVRTAHATKDGACYAGWGEWELRGRCLFMERTIAVEPALSYELTLEPFHGGINVTIAVRNLSASAWAWPTWADFCLQLDPNMTRNTDLYDPDGTRTFVPVLNGMKTVASQAGAKVASQHRAQFYVRGINPTYPICHGDLIARSNLAGNKWTGFLFEGSPGLFANFEQGNCIHANPQLGHVRVHEQKTCRGKITFDQTTLAGVCSVTRFDQ